MKRKISGKAPALNTNPNLQPTVHTVLPTKEEWLNTADAMAHFKVSDRTLLRWRKSKQIPSLKIAGTIMYPYNLLNKILLNKIENSISEEP